MEEMIVADFDYSQLSSETLDRLLEKENKLEIVLKRSRKEIGQILLEIKDILPHGQFGVWCGCKGITKNMAWRCVQEATGREVKSSKIELLPELPEHISENEERADLQQGYAQVRDELAQPLG